MGYEHVDAALESDRYDGVKKAVVVALCKFINAKRAERGDTEVWPGLKTLCRTAGWGRRAVQRAIDALAADKNPIVEIKAQGNGTETTHYIVHLDRLGGVRGTLPVASETPHRSVRETPEWRIKGATVVPLGHPNQEVNREEKKELDQEAATAERAAAAASSTELKDGEKELLDYWYQHKLHQTIDTVRPGRIETDLPALREIGSVVNGKTRDLFSFVLSDPGEGSWAGWDKKSPNLPALLKHVRKGNLLQQFRETQETPSSALHLCDACGQAAENFTEFNVTYQSEPRRYCEVCVAEAEEETPTAPSGSPKKKARATAASAQEEEGVLVKNISVDEL